MTSPPTTAAGVLVTGAARRIGSTIARDLAATGCNVAVHYHRSADHARALVRDLNAHGAVAAPVQADLADEAALAGLLAAARTAVGPITAVVNNAAVFEDDDVMTADADGWRRHMAVNLRAPFVLAQVLARDLEPGTPGAVVNIIDQRVWNPTPRFTTYTLSKMALWDLTRMLARALAPGVRVNAVGPGPVLPSPRQTDADFERQWSAQPLGRPVAPEDVAGAVRFLLDAPSVTGQMIAVDSGQHMGWAPPAGDMDFNE